ncbi:hypothetical protein DXG01_004827 [Tephrocybe rancida]|nr:hypothetical protein DXG01_004827 [Tephrocybe rancida]
MFGISYSATKFMIATAAALPAASLCISRRLYLIATDSAAKSEADKRREMLLDLGIGLGAPAICAILHIVVQKKRFNIFEDYGCTPSVYNTPLAYVLVQAPVLVVALVSAGYCFLSLMKFKRSGVENLSTFGSSSNHYLRLLCLASVEVILSTFGALVRIVTLSQGQVRPWISWDHTHARLSIIELFPARVWRADPAWKLALEEARWGLVLRGLLFFALFSFTKESRMNYGFAYRSITNWFGVASEPRPNPRSAVPSRNFGAKSSLESATASPAAVGSIVLDISLSNSASNISGLSSADDHEDYALRLEDNEGNSSTPRSSTTAFNSVYSADAEHGHGHRTRSHISECYYSGIHTTIIFPSAVVYKSKDLPLLPQEAFTRLSAATSESMYSTSTLPETDFVTFTDLVSPPDAFFHSHSMQTVCVQSRCATIQSEDPAHHFGRPVDLDPEREAGRSFLDLSAASPAPLHPPDRA